MGAEERRTAQWGLVWVVNCASATALILFNSMMMAKYLLMAPITVSAIQLLITAASVALLEALGAWGENEKRSVPAKHVAAFVIISCISLASANYSLAWNSLGMYQVFKLGLVPITFGIELLLALRKYQLIQAVALASILAGLLVTMYQDASIRFPGFLAAILFVVSTSLQQVLCGRLQQMYKLKPHQLLQKTACIQGGLLLLSGPFLDKVLTGAWISSWEVNVPGLEMLLASCGAAVVVNFTQYFILGEYSASSYQAFGTSSKSVMVLIGGAILFSSRQWVNPIGYIGVAIGLVGLLFYGIGALRQPPSQTSLPTVKSPFGNGGSLSPQQ